MAKVGIMLCVALPLAAVDLLVKTSQTTEPWAYHRRSPGWLLLSIALLAALVVVSRIPARLVAPAAGIVAGGVLGNGLSAAWNGMEVPNPLIVGVDTAVIAFNLADVWAAAGIPLLVCAIGAWLIRNRDRIPPQSEVHASRGRALRRLFGDRRP